jgi:predicted metal-dependent phosphoesterase TrpH
MKIDLHIHTKTCSDGNLPIEEAFEEARNRGIDLISITDHDSIECQERAIALARKHGISYITGLLGYGYDIGNQELKSKLQLIKRHRKKRARQILENLNVEFDKEGITRFTGEDLKKIEDSVDGVFGRPHIANYLIETGIVKDIQEAFDKYLVKCDVAKYPLSLDEASRLIRNAGGILVLAHPNDPNGTSLVSITRDLDEQTKIMEEYMLRYIDGVECWHARYGERTTGHYIEFARKHDILMTGGSDCHQKPLLLGTLDIPAWVAAQFSGRKIAFSPII